MPASANRARPSVANRKSRPTRAASPPSTPASPRYAPALDGLRALAVVAVIVYHLGYGWAPGGLLGVTVFFVLSGYLITSLLVAERIQTGRIQLGAFWMRRARRLLPAVVTVIVCTALLCMLFDQVLLTKMRPDVIPSLLFVNNWWQVFHEVSYFDALGAPSPLQHFWSLGIEEQFYLVWPLLVAGLLALGASHAHLRRAALALAAASVVAMALLYEPGGDPSRVYYGTDTRAFSLLIGAALGLAWPFGPLGEAAFGITRRAGRTGRAGMASQANSTLPAPLKVALDVASIAALGGLVAMMCLVDGFAEMLYPGGLLLASVLTAIVIAGLVHPGSLLGRIFAARPLVWVGKRSYGMYLWHFPLIMLICPTDGTTPEWWVAVGAVGAVVAASALSYRFIEDPIRKGAIGKAARALRTGELSASRAIRRVAPAFVGGAAACTVAVVGLTLMEDVSAVEDIELYQDETPAVVGMLDVGSDREMSEADKAAQEAAEAEGLDVLVIGDSVCKKAIYSFPGTFPYGALDAALNRRMSQGAEIYRSYAEQGIESDVVVFALGNNAAVTSDQIDEVMEAVGADKQVFFVNTRNATGWMGSTNAALADAAVRYGNAHVIDWMSASSGHGEYFEADGMHLKPVGAEAYTKLIHDSIADYLPDRSKEVEGASPEAQEVNDKDGALYLPSV